MSLPACPLITFYSYKGGVGRSQTLANVAVALANRGKNVIMVDFDLESPGLHRYFSPLHAPERRLGDDELNEKGGLLDWLSKAQTVPDDEPFITDHLIECTSDALRPYQGWLKLIACGAQTVDAVSGRGYSARVRDFNWRQFEQDSYGQQYLELMRRQLQKAGADYILLDSRTGVTDVGLLCTFVLPDVVVMLFALHDQGIQGVRWLAGKLKAHREVMQAEAQEDEQVHYPQKILLVPTRVEESQELDLRDHWIQRARDAFHGEGHIWLGELGQRLPYLPKSAFGENIWVSRYKEPTELGKALEALTDSITGLSQEGEPSRPTPSFEKLCSQWTEWEETRRSYEDRFAFFRGIDASTSIRLISERARGLSGLNERLYLHQQELTAQLTAFTKTAGVTMDASALHPEEPESLSQHRSVWKQLETSLSQLKQKVDDRRSELRTKLKEVLDDEERLLNEELMRFEPELDAGAWQRLEERLEERIQWYRSQSIEAKLRRNELEKDQLVRRFPSDKDRTVWLEEQLQRILEDASLEEQEQLYTLRNLLRLYPTLNARPSRLLWDAWDTVCMLAELVDVSALVDVPDKSTLNAQLFHESGCSLWEAEWKALLSAGSLEHDVLSSQAGAEARRQLKEIIEHSDSLVEDLSEELAGRIVEWLADDDLAAVLSLVRARREDPLLLVVLEAVCQVGVETTSPWLLPLSASLLLELGVKHQRLWEPFLQILLHEGYEREAFYFLVALSHREQELATKKAELRELPTRFVLSLASEERCHPGLQALLQLPSLRQLLELSSAGVAALKIWDLQGRFPLGSGLSEPEKKQLQRLEEAETKAKAYSEPSLPPKWPSSRYYASKYKEHFSGWITRVMEVSSSYEELEEVLDRFDLDEWIKTTHAELKQKGTKIYLPDELEKRAFVKSVEQSVKALRELNSMRADLAEPPKVFKERLHKAQEDWQQLRREILENSELSPALCERLTGEKPKSHPASVSRTSAQTDKWPKLNELLLYPELLTLSPILLDVEAGNTFEHLERFARHLLEYCAGRRTAAGVAEQLLETRRFDRLSQLLSSEPLPEIKQALQQAWRESLRQFEGFIEETLVTLAQLKAQGLTPQDLKELNDWLEQLRNSLDELPRVEEPKFLDALQRLAPDPFTDLKSYQGFVLDAKNACQALVLQRQEQARRRVLELKRKLDDLNNQLELQEPPLSDAQLEQLARIRIRASEGLRRRDASLLESLEAVLRQSLDAPEHLLSWSAPENPPPLSAAATVSEHRPSAAAAPSARVQGPAASELSLSPPAERFGSEPTGAPRLSPSRLRERWEQLSEWIRRELEQRKLKGKAGVSRSADDVDLRWEKERLEPHRVREESLLQLAGDMAALHADQPAGMRALAVWLLCRVFHNLQLDRFERLVELSTEALSLLELPGLKLSQHDKWVQLAQRLNVLALRLTFSGERPEGERLSELLEPELELQLNALEHRGLLPELSGVMLQLGLRESEDAVLERLLPWLRREPLPTAALLETLCEDGALLARSGLLGEASEQAWQGLRAPLIAARQGLKLLSRLDLLERGRVETVLKRLHQVDQQLQLRPALSRVRSLLDNVLEECLAPLQLEFRPMLAGVLATALQRLREELEAPSTELTGLNHRMLTTRVQVEAGLQPCLVVELHYLKGPCTLKEVQTQATLYDKGDIPIPDGLRPIPPLPRVPVGQVREVRIPLNPRAERLLEAGRLFIRQFSRGDDGKSQPLNLRVENLTVTLERGQKEDFQPAPNPFVVGTPIQRYEQIFGRDEQVEQLRQTLMGAHQDQVVMVMGERRSGKTTLLNKFKKHPLVESRYWILDVDLQHLMDAERMADFFRERFAEPIQRLLRRNGLVAPELPSFERSPGPAFSTFMGEVDVLLKKRDKRLLLVIDELEKLFENIERREQRREKDSEPESGVSELSRTTVAILRDVLQKMERVSFVLAGVTPVLRRFTTHKGERLFKLAVEVECKSLSPEACIQLICEPIKQHYEVLQLAYQHIIRETGRQPYLIQLVCSELFRYAMKHRLLHLTRLHVEQVLDELVPQRRHFSYLNDDVRDVDDYRIVRAVAMVQRGNVGVPFSDILAMLTRMGHTFQEEKLFDSLKRLELNAPQVLERRVGTRDTFRLTVGLYARHLRTLLREERW